MECLDFDLHCIQLPPASHQELENLLHHSLPVESTVGPHPVPVQPLLLGLQTHKGLLFLVGGSSEVGQWVFCPDLVSYSKRALHQVKKHLPT